MEKKVLIVDDEKDILEMLEKRLTNRGYAVVKAENGQDAIVIAKAQHPDLIVLDIVMPGMDGSTTAEVLKNDPQTKDIPVIFLTCLVTKSEETDDNNIIGGKYFIAKPFDAEELMSAIDKHLGV